MPDAASLALLPALFALSAIGPGFLIVRRQDWQPHEKLTGALALSLMIVGQASFLIFALSLHPILHGAVLLACIAATVAFGRELAALLRATEVRQSLLGGAVVVTWLVALSMVLRNHGAGPWYGDWLEHFDRSRFLLGHLALGRTFFDYPLAARPPLMNAIAAHFMALTEVRYPFYQLMAVFLGALTFFPSLQLARLFAPRSRSLPWVLVAQLMFLPMFVQNATFPWTKLATDFFVLAGVAFYVAGWQRGDRSRTLTGFTCLFAGILTHYSAVPYTLFVTLHFACVALEARSDRLRSPAMILLGGVLVLGPWFLWSSYAYGVRDVLTSNSSWREAAPLTAAENLEKSALNLRDTIVPHLLRRLPDEPIRVVVGWGTIRDTAFKAYQNNLPLTLGSLGLPLLAYDLLRRRRQSGGLPSGMSPGAGVRPPGSARFWLAFVIVSMVVGVASYGGREALGLAHVTLQPLTLLGASLLASGFASRARSVRWLAFTGVAVDAMLGVLLHVFMESLPLDAAPPSSVLPGLETADLLIGSSRTNWALKTDSNLRFLGDWMAPWRAVAWGVVGALFLGALAFLGRLAARGESPEVR